MITIEGLNVLPGKAVSNDQAEGSGVLPTGGNTGQEAGFRNTFHKIIGQEAIRGKAGGNSDAGKSLVVLPEGPRALPVFAGAGGNSLPAEDAAQSSGIDSSFVASVITPTDSSDGTHSNVNLAIGPVPAVSATEVLTPSPELPSETGIYSGALRIDVEDVSVPPPVVDVVEVKTVEVPEDRRAHYGFDSIFGANSVLAEEGGAIHASPSSVSVAVAAQIHGGGNGRISRGDVAGPIVQSAPRVQPEGDRFNLPVGDGGRSDEWLDTLHASVRNNLLTAAESPKTDRNGAALHDLAVARPVNKREFSDFVQEQSAIDEGLSHASRNVLARETPVFAATDAQSVAGEKLTVPSLERPLGHKEWGQDLGDRVLWMAGRSLQAADLRLNPPSLGPVEVRISMQQDQASIAFSSQHAVVREAIEAAIPKLREMFVGQQINLVDVNVSQQSFSNQQQQFGGSGGFGSQDNGAAFASDTRAEEVLSQGVEEESTVVGNRLLNLYV